MQQENLLNNICILQFDDNLFEEECCKKLRDLKCKLEKLGYDIEKINFLKNDIKLLSTEIELCLINAHFIFLIYDEKHRENIQECLCKMFYIKSKWLDWKRLRSEKSNNDFSVLYFQRIFLIGKYSIDESYNVIEKYLLYFMQPKPFTRVIKLKQDYHLSEIDNHNKGVQKEVIDNNTLRILSYNLTDLLQCEINITELWNESNYISFTEFDHYLPDCLVNFNKYQEAFKILGECFEKYAPENVCVCFNGGKDCTVLLHLTLLVLYQKYGNYNKLCCLYVESNDPFSNIQTFIKDVTKYYNIPTISLKTSIKQAMMYLRDKHPNIKACLMGTRRTDPYSAKLQSFQMTDTDWPQFMRIFPILDWHYSDIWDYIHTFRLPYCNLYDVGYTSLGSVKNTQRNPQLLMHNSKVLSSENYLPAYKLIDQNLERSGRFNDIE